MCVLYTFWLKSWPKLQGVCGCTCVCLCMCVFVHVCVYMYMYAYVSVSLYGYVQVYMCARIFHGNYYCYNLGYPTSIRNGTQ